MPPLPAVAGVIRCIVKYTYGGDLDVISRFFVKYSGTAPTVAQLNAFSNSIFSAEQTDLQSLRGGAVAIIDVLCEDLTSSTSAVGSTAGNSAGTRSGGVLPASSAMVCSYEIARRYRGGHPRGYWPLGTDTDLTTAQLWTSSFVTACQTGFQNFFTAVLAAGWTGAGTLTQENVSYYAGFTPVRNPITGRYRNVPNIRGAAVTDAVTAVIARQRIGSQRRRIPA